MTKDQFGQTIQIVSHRLFHMYLCIHKLLSICTLALLYRRICGCMKEFLCNEWYTAYEAIYCK